MSNWQFVWTMIAFFLIEISAKIDNEDGGYNLDWVASIILWFIAYLIIGIKVAS